MHQTEKQKDLQNIQQWMQDALIHSGVQTNPNDIETHIEPSNTLSAKDRLAIYQRSYYSRLIQCMKEQFKALCHALGEKLFEDFAREYLRVVPSTSPTLSDLGNQFAEYLESTRPDKASNESWVDFMIDLAKFEWSLYQLFDARGIENLEKEATPLTGENIQLQSCFNLSEYNFPVNEYYRAVSHEKETTIPYPQKTFIALSRKDFMINISSLHPVQFFLLKKIAAGEKDHQIRINQVAEKFNKPAELIQQQWEKWFEDWKALDYFVHAAK